ncbi:hypothetical protein BGX28_004316 [Mortierella sp. GBA30]|nr:hypothetical protein BGX28_004316 [Mortierella sp. GBA30]
MVSESQRRQLSVSTIVDHRHRTFSAEDLTSKLQKLHGEQQYREKQQTLTSPNNKKHNSHSNPDQIIQIDPALQKRTQETIHEILERLERQKQEGWMAVGGAAPGMEDNGSGRLRHTHRLNPNVLARESGSLRQTHGKANLRHS